jgi:hypothetical protein
MVVPSLSWRCILYTIGEKVAFLYLVLLLPVDLDRLRQCNAAT